jgi:hypothetical protein
LVLVLLAPSRLCAAALDESNSVKVPPIVPAADEKPILGVPAWSINEELRQCMSDAAAVLKEQAHAELHARIAPAHAYYSPESGYILRADFTRDDVSAPLINRIVCWQNGQLIVSSVSAPPLPSEESERPLAVPQLDPPRQY